MYALTGLVAAALVVVAAGPGRAIEPHGPLVEAAFRPVPGFVAPPDGRAGFGPAGRRLIPSAPIHRGLSGAGLSAPPVAGDRAGTVATGPDWRAAGADTAPSVWRQGAHRLRTSFGLGLGHRHGTARAVMAALSSAGDEAPQQASSAEPGMGLGLRFDFGPEGETTVSQRGILDLFAGM